MRAETTMPVRSAIRIESQKHGVPMIEVQHLTKRYGPVTAVDDVSFRVEKGEILGFLGPNGAGKTSTMRVITGYMPPSDGKVVVAGFDVFTHPIEAKKRTGYLPETPPLYPDMTVREYLHFAARIKAGELSTAERNARVDAGDEEDARRRHGEPPVRQAVEGLQAARRPGAGAHPRSRSAGARRADGRPRSEADHRDARPDSQPRRRPHDHPDARTSCRRSRRRASGSSSSTRARSSRLIRRKT